MAKKPDEFILIGLIVLMILPFLFFPATTGMFAVIRGWVMNSHDTSIITSFLKYYKENYIRSMIGGFIIVLIWLIFIVDYYFFTTHVNGHFKYLFIFLAIFLIAFTLHFISGTVHFEAKLFTSLKNALFITIGSPILSAGIGIINVLVIYISFNYLTVLIPLFIGPLIAIVSFYGFYKVYLKIDVKIVTSLDNSKEVNTYTQSI